jgi:hypothetical protein
MNIFTPTGNKKGSTVTVVLLVVLLTFEVLVVALVADVVLATYPSRHVNRKATNKIKPVHSSRASLGKFEVTSFLTDPYFCRIQSAKKQHCSVARASCVDNRGRRKLETKHAKRTKN